MSKMSAFAMIILLAGCAGRSAQPVDTSQAQDNTMSCAAIQAEIAQNNQQISDLGTEQGLKVAQNVGAGALGFFTFGIGWALMDWQGAAGAEKSALERRNAYLGTLAAQRCGENNR